MTGTDLVFRLFGIDVSAGTALDRVRLRAVETGGALATLGKVGAMALVAVGVGAATLAVKSVEAAASFQRAMTLLHTQAQVPQKDIAQLGEGVLNLAGQVGFSPDSLANALFFVESNMASLGIKPKEALNMVKIAAEGAQIGMADLQDTTTALTATMAAYRTQGVTAQQAMAILNATVGTGEMKMQDLNQAIKTGVMGTMQTYGVKLNEIGAALAVFGDNNLRGAQAGTQLRMAVQALAKPIATGKEQLAKLGLTVTSLRDTMSQKGLSGALDLLHGKLIKGKVPLSQWGAIFTTVFGKRAGVGLLELLKEFDRYNSKIPALNKATKTFGDAWVQTQKTVQVQWEKVKANFQVLLIRIGNLLLPWVTNTVLPALNKIIDWAQKNLPHWAALFTTAIGNVKGEFDKLSPTISQVIGWVQGKLIPTLMSAAHTMSADVVNAVAAVNKVLQQNPEIVGEVVAILKILGSMFTNIIIPALAAATGFLVNQFAPALDLIAPIITGIIIPAFNGMMRIWLIVVGNLLHGIDLITSHIPGMADPLAGVVAKFDAFANDVTSALDGIPKQVNTNIYVGLSGPGAKDLHNLPHGNQFQRAFAVGGSIPADGIPTLVGENGPELFVPKRSGRIIPNSMLGGYMSGSPGGGGGRGGGGNVHVHVHNAVIGNERQIAAVVTTAIKRARSSGYPVPA